MNYTREFNEFRKKEVKELSYYSNIVFAIPIIIGFIIFSGNEKYNWEFGFLFMFILLSLVLIKVLIYYLPFYRKRFENTYNLIQKHSAELEMLSHQDFACKITDDFNVFDFFDYECIPDIKEDVYNYLKIKKVFNLYFDKLIKLEGNCFKMEKILVIFFRKKMENPEFRSAFL